MNEVYMAHARKEITEYHVYGILAKREKQPENKALLEKLSAQEKSHYEFWKSLMPGSDPKPYAVTIFWIPFLRIIFGVTFTAKLLETHEQDAIAGYEAMMPMMAPEHQARLREIIDDERSHESGLIAGVKEKRISYLGFIALGLADAIVEITGVHAGFLGVTGSTLIAGVSGVIVGFAAAISMGSAAYLQAKQDPEKSVFISAFATALSYLGAVVCLALPYFLIRTMITAFVISTGVGAALLAAFTFYGAVVFDRQFIREFGESLSLMLGTALATFLLGTFINRVFHIGAGSF